MPDETPIEGRRVTRPRRGGRRRGRRRVRLLITALPLLLVTAVAWNLRPRSEVVVTSPPDDPRTVWSRPAELSLLTLNVHDLYVASRDRSERMRGIGQWLAQLDPDVCALQEAFVAKDRRTLLEELSGSRLAHHAYFDYGHVGSGLLVLSAWPIVSTSFHAFQARGKWYKAWHGDWWAGKGVALVRIRHPDGDVDVYDTHAHAAYVDDVARDEYLAVRSAQHEEMMIFVATHRDPESPAFLLGDLNCSTASEQYSRLLAANALEPVLDIASPFDHIFVVPRERFEVLVLDSGIPPAPRARDGPPLSDHNAYWTRVRIEPRSMADER